VGVCTDESAERVRGRGHMVRGRGEGEREGLVGTDFPDCFDGGELLKEDRWLRQGKGAFS
jgi:hypothetical protein